MRSTLRQLALLLLIAAFPALISGARQLQWRRQEPLLPGEVRPATARLWAEHVLWVDARSRKLYEAKHVPRAILFNQEEWDQLQPHFFQAWSADRTVVVYDEGNGVTTSAALAERLRNELKIESVYVLKGGFKAWRE